MKAAELPSNEIARIAALQALEVLDTAPEQEFDAIVRVASIVTGMPISLISLVDSNRQWFKSNIGLAGTTETSRDVAFCGHAILDEAIFEVSDATRDDRFADNPLVVGGPNIRFYAGAPIELSDGNRVGTLCVMDRVTRTLSESQRDVLTNLAYAAARALEGRLAVRTTRKLANELAEQHELLRVTLHSIGDAVITTDADRIVLWMNPIAEKLTGWASADACGEALARVMDLGRHAASEDDGTDHRDGPNKVTSEIDAISLTSTTGLRISIECSESPIFDDAGATVGLVLVFRDVSEQRRLSSEMTHRATHDALTGLTNRGEFEVRLELARIALQAGGAHGVLMFIDLDRFKVVNDTCGHGAGDQLLRQVSRILRDSMRAGDTVARLGGDEFGILLHGCTVDVARQIGQRLCDHMEKFRFVHEDQRMRIGTSIGVVPIDSRWPTAAAVLQAADAACYTAKQEGRNRVHVWCESDVAIHALSGETQWASRIEKALDDDRFLLHAQIIEPLNFNETGLHAEALLRMLDDDGELVAPGAFLPAAERFQLAPRVDRWVLRQSVAWLQRHPSRSSVARLSVNLSGQSLGDREFCDWVVAMLSDAGDRVCLRLCLEITETAAVTHIANAAQFLARVRAFGVRIALDDFGAGASSFGYLKTLVVDVLKIDGQFVRGVVDDPLNAAAVRCFVDVAKVMGLETVAEFVDHPAVLARIEAMGIDFAQGFLLHRPEPIDQLLMPRSRGPKVIANGR